MLETLEIVINNYVDNTDTNEAIPPSYNEEKRILINNSAKEALKETIICEVKAVVKEEALREAREEIDKQTQMQKIRELKKLMVEGFLVALFVGLFVNQTTDFIGFFKGSVSLSSIKSTVICAAIFLLICLLIFIVVFLSEIVAIVNREKKK